MLTRTLAFAALMLFFFAVVDRIAVTVGNQVITETEILHEIELTAFLNNVKPIFTPETKHQAAERLIEQKLVRKEMDMGRYPSATDDQVKVVLDKLIKDRGGEAELDRQLAADGLTRDDLEKYLHWQQTLIRFIDLRFRPIVEVTAPDVADYYKREVVPTLKPGDKTKLADKREEILETLRSQGADEKADEWLKHAKTTTKIEYRKEAFQ